MGFGNALLKYIGYSVYDVPDLPFRNKGKEASAKPQASVRPMALVKVWAMLNSEPQQRMEHQQQLRRVDLSPI